MPRVHPSAHVIWEAQLLMGIIARYVRWLGHNAGGNLPPVDVLAGLLADGSARSAADGSQDSSGDVLVFVPPQWLGDWETGRPLPPGYQYVWRAPRACLQPLDGPPRSSPYRPLTLPPAAVGSFSTRRRPTARARRG